MRRNLVIVRAGDASRHPAWLEGASGRTWDLLVSYYGDDAERFRRIDVPRFDAKGPKYPALGGLLGNQASLIGRYDYVWLPDDDIECTAGDIDRLFHICREQALWLAQPSLTVDSQFSWPATLHNSFCQLRFTNFVEIMMPCFERVFLESCRSSFARSESGWGLDLLWAQLARSSPRRMAIIDDVVVAHRRSLTGPYYPYLHGRSAVDEMDELLQAEGITDRRVRVEALVSRSGRRLGGRSFAARLFLAMGHALAAGRGFALGYPNRHCHMANLKQALWQVPLARFIACHRGRSSRRA